MRSTLIQTRVPPAMLGRISSVNQIFIGSSNEIGAFESGVAARLLGAEPSVMFGGFVTIVVVAVIAWWAPELRRLDRIDAPDAGVTERLSRCPVMRTVFTFTNSRRADHD